MATHEVFQIHQRTAPAGAAGVHDQVVLDHLQRERGRLKVSSSSGAELRIFLDRGKPLAIGELLQSDSGHLFEVVGAAENVVVARCEDWEVFARACYHLGNRHVKIEVGNCWLSMTPDSVLEQMLEQLGLTVTHEQRVFVPESGAYAGAGHGHHHH